MDAVSYAHSAKQAQRIKKIINDPDSESGIVTTPKVIQSGETITIPNGRMAVLPDLVIEGDLVLEGTGDVFIPSGSTLTGTVTINTAQTITGPKEFTQSPKVPDGVEPTDVVNKSQLDNSSISKVASSVLLSGNVAVANSVITKSNANVTYTGNGTTQDIVTGISSVDFTVSGNGSGYYHDRVAGDCIVKNDAGTVIESGSCVVNTSKVHIKGRNNTESNYIYDGIRGKSNEIYTNLTNVELGGQTLIENFTSQGLTLGSGGGNVSTRTYILHQTLYTHIKWGLTSQGKRYISAYNPVTREVMTMYQGSGVAGHQIPNPLGIKLDYIEVKNLDNISSWPTLPAYNGRDVYLNLSETYGHLDGYWEVGDGIIAFSVGTSSDVNTSNNTYISYGFANSETKIITQYQGTGLAGNFVETKDVNDVAKKPRRVITKRVDSIGNWVVYDSERGNGVAIYLNNSNIEDYSGSFPSYSKSNGFSLDNTGSWTNASGGQYISIVEFDTTASNDDTYFDLPTDNTNLSITNGKLAFTNGRSSNGGYKVETQDFTGSVDFSGISDGIKYIARDKLGNVFGYDGVSIGLYDKTSADDNRLVFDTESGKWFTTTGGELVTNGTFDNDVSGWTAVNAPSNIIWENGMLKMVNTSGPADCYQTIAVSAGKTIIIEATLTLGTQVGIYIGLGTSNTTNDLYYSSNFTGTKVISFTPSVTGVIYLRLGSNDATIGRTAYFDNISVFKVEATLGTELPNPICFIDDKPYQVTSGTPMDRLVDYPSILKNVMESTYVDGMLISNGNRKVIELGTIFNNNRYVIDNPFGNDKYMDCDVKVELYINSEWGEPQFVYASGGYGVKASSAYDGIRVTTGSLKLKTGLYANSGHSFNYQAEDTTSAPARVIVTYVGVTK